MFWALDLDDFNGSQCGEGTYPLLKAVNRALTGRYPNRHDPNTQHDELEHMLMYSALRKPVVRGKLRIGQLP